MPPIVNLSCLALRRFSDRRTQPPVAALHALDKPAVSGLLFDLLPLRSRLLDAVNELSKHVHGRENPLIRDQSAQHDFMERTTEAMEAFVDSLHACRNAVLTPIAEALDRAAVDEIVTHHSVDEIYVDEVTLPRLAFTGSRT